MGRVEKLCRNSTPKVRRHLKRLARRARRRSERRDPEGAPTRIRELTRGWSD